MDEPALRQHLANLLESRGAHADFDAVIRHFPAELRGVRAPGHAHTAWELLEHLRIAQWDILEFSRDAGHVSPEFPSGYWPGAEAPADADAWDAAIASFNADLAAMRDLVLDPSTDLFTPLPWGDGQTVLREALLTADHNAYHLGQIVTLRQALGAWPPKAPSES